ncbi:hypothetical protein IIC68_03700 [archaeon]|nr:hypothetical protein [archaeon]
MIEAAIESNSKYIITGDKHLLNLESYKRIVILTPNDFIKKHTTKH